MIILDNIIITINNTLNINKHNKYKTLTVRARHSRDQNPRPRGQTLNQRM